MKTFVFNGWASEDAVWAKCRFPRERIFGYVEQLDALPEAELARTEAATLVGFSMGGSTALRMLLRFPERVRALVLVSTTPRMMADAATAWPGMSERRLQALRLGTFAMMRENSAMEPDEAQLDRGLEYLRETDLRSALVDFAAAGRTAGLPVRIFQAERDGIVRPGNADFLAGLFPRAEVIRVASAEHTLPSVVPELIDRAVAEVIAASAQGDAAR